MHPLLHLVECSRVGVHRIPTKCTHCCILWSAAGLGSTESTPLLHLVECSRVRVHRIPTKCTHCCILWSAAGLGSTESLQNAPTTTSWGVQQGYGPQHLSGYNNCYSLNIEQSLISTKNQHVNPSQGT